MIQAVLQKARVLGCATDIQQILFGSALCSSGLDFPNEPRPSQMVLVLRIQLHVVVLPLDVALHGVTDDSQEVRPEVYPGRTGMLPSVQRSPR